MHQDFAYNFLCLFLQDSLYLSRTMAFDHGQAKMLVLVAPGILLSEHLNWARIYGSGRFFFDAAKQDWGYTHVTIPQLRIVPVFQLADGYIWRFGFTGQNEQMKEQMWCRTYFADTWGWLNCQGVCASQQWYAGGYPSISHPCQQLYFADGNPLPPPPLSQQQQGGDHMTGLASLIMKMDRKLDQQLGVMREESLHAKGEMEVRFQSMQLAVEQQQSTQLEHFDTVLDGTKEALLDRCETAEKTCTDAARLSKQACEGAIETHFEATGHLITDAEVRQNEKCDEMRQDAAKKQASVQKQFAENKAKMEEMKVEMDAMPYRVIETLMQIAAAKRKFALADADVKMLQIAAEPCAPRGEQEEEEPDWGDNKEPEGEPVDADKEAADPEDAAGPAMVEADGENALIQARQENADNAREGAGPAMVDADDDNTLGQACPEDDAPRNDADPAALMPASEQGIRHPQRNPQANLTSATSANLRVAADDGPRDDKHHSRTRAPRSLSPTPHSRANLRRNSRSRRNAASRSRSAARHTRVRLRSNSRSHRRRR